MSLDSPGNKEKGSSLCLAHHAQQNTKRNEKTRTTYSFGFSRKSRGFFQHLLSSVSRIDRLFHVRFLMYFFKLLFEDDITKMQLKN